MDTDERPRDVRLVGNHVEVFFPEDWVVYEADVRRLFARAPHRVTETTPIPGIGARWIAEFDNRSEAADALDRLLSGDTTEEAPPAPAQTLGAASHPRASESSRRDRLRRRLLIVVVVALLTMFAWFVWPTPYVQLGTHGHYNRFTGARCSVYQSCW